MPKFVRWGAFRDNFEPYRVWEFLWDVPEHDIRRGYVLMEVGPGSHDQGAGKKALWDGHRFQVRDSDSGDFEVVCELEEWQVVKLFSGEVPPWPLEGFALQELRRVFKDLMPLGPQAMANVLEVVASMTKSMIAKIPEQQPDDAERMPPGAEEALALVDGRPSMAMVMEDIPAVGIRKGDALVYVADADARPTMRGHVRWLDMDDYQAIRDALSPSTLVMIPGGPMYRTVESFLADKKRWGQRLRVWHSRLAVLRSHRESVSEPIHATTDDAALFELLHQVGGRMPVVR